MAQNNLPVLYSPHFHSVFDAALGQLTARVDRILARYSLPSTRINQEGK